SDDGVHDGARAGGHHAADHRARHHLRRLQTATGPLLPRELTARVDDAADTGQQNEPGEIANQLQDLVGTGRRLRGRITYLRQYGRVVDLVNRQKYGAHRVPFSIAEVPHWVRASAGSTEQDMCSTGITASLLRESRSAPGGGGLRFFQGGTGGRDDLRAEFPDVQGNFVERVDPAPALCGNRRTRGPHRQLLRFHQGPFLVPRHLPDLSGE